MNQNFYAAVTNDAEFQIDGVPVGTYDLAVRGFRPVGEKQPRSVYYSRKSITVKAPLNNPLRLGAWRMVDAETFARVARAVGLEGAVDGAGRKPHGQN